MADDAFLVEDVDGGPSMHVPLCGDRAGCVAVDGLPPGDALILQDLVQRLTASVAVDSDEREWLVLQVRHHLLLMRNHCAAGASPESPEVEHDDFASIIG